MSHSVPSMHAIFPQQGQGIHSRRRQELERRKGRTCTECSKPLSVYNPAPTCGACDGGIDPDARIRRGRVV